MTEFREADTRLGAMHGYEPTLTGVVATHCHRMVSRPGFDGRCGRVYEGEVLLCAEHGRTQLDAIEQKLDALIHAMKAGAIGRWQAQPVGSRCDELAPFDGVYLRCEGSRGHAAPHRYPAGTP